MTRLFSGGEMGAFVPSTATVYEDTTGTQYDTAFCRTAILCQGSTSYADSFEFSGQTDIWIHGEVRNSSVFGNFPFLGLLNSTGTEVYQIAPLGSGATNSIIWQMYRWNGSAFVTHGSTATVSDARQTYDLHVDIANDTVKLYVSGTLRITASGTDLSGLTNIAQIRLRSTNASYHSQIMAQTTSTIGQRLMTAPVTATGATNQWTGDYGAVDEAAYSDSDFMFSDTPAQVEMMVATPIGSTSGYTIGAIAVTARANTDGTGPQNLRLMVRSGSTNYDNGADMLLDAGYGAFCALWETDPGTTLAWTAPPAQIGVKSAT